MRKDKELPSGSSKLRCLAEERLRSENIAAGPSLSNGESLRLIHELQVHQIELEMQNEELRQARDERQKMEALLGKYSDLYDFAPVGYFNLDQGGIIRAVNLTGAGFLGVERSLLISRRLDIFISDETRPVFHDFLDKVFASETKETCEVVLQKERHSPLFVQVEAVVSESRGECHAIVIDITERKRAEEALQKSRDYLDNIINSIPGPILIKDRAHRYMLVNDAECAFIGYSREELIGRNAHDFFPKEQVEVFWEKDEIVFETGQENINEEEITTAHGDMRVIVTKKSLHKDLSGNKYLVEIIRDITDYKLAERELRESELRYRGLIELSPDAIYIHTGGKLIFANTEGAKLLGAERPEDIYGREVLDFVHPDNRDFVQQRISNAFRSGEPNPPAEELFIRLDGSPVPVEVASVPFKYRGENALQIIVRDITDRKKMQNEMLKAQKLESLGVLAGGIAHDFNNILTGIIGNLSIAKLQLDPYNIILKRLELCEKAAFQASELTRQLLTFARGGEPVKKLMAIAPLIRDTVSFALRGSNVRSVIELEDDLWSLEADESQLSQVLNNLLLNAVQAMPTGGEVTVRAANEKIGLVNPHNLAAGAYIRITVDDSGHGISQEDLSMVFDPYFTTKPQASGLGLSSVYSIVKRHAGAVEMSSTLGVGSCFAIHLPAFPGRRLEDAVTNQFAELKGSGRVLVMDDEDFIRDVASEILHFIGYEVDTCGDGREAVGLFRAAREGNNPFSAVILDLTIPGGMGGKEAAALMLEIDPDAVIIVSSGYSNDPVVANFRQHGFSGVISKPYNAKGMALELHRLIQKNIDRV